MKLNLVNQYQLGNKSISKRNENDRDLGAIGDGRPGGL